MAKQEKAEQQQVRGNYVPDPSCECQTSRMRVNGYVWRKNEMGDNELAHCPCWKRWHDAARHVVDERQRKAAGE